MAAFDFEGNSIGFKDGDTIAAALYRSGVRTFTRSLKYHRRRGLYCLTGDCPNCILTVDGMPGVRACCTDAHEGQTVARHSGWPSTEHDLLSLTDRMHALMPVGFYYKTFIRPRFAWELAEKVIRRHTGLGDLPTDRGPATPKMHVRHVHANVVVIGGGVAGLAAARAAASAGDSVLVCDEGRLGEKLPASRTLQRIGALAGELQGTPGVTILERHTAVGIYEGPLVPLVGPDEIVRVDADRVIVATGAVETHAVFPGNDLPGVWLGRGAARMAGAQEVPIGGATVVATSTREGLEHIATLSNAGVRVVAAVFPGALVPEGLDHRMPAGVESIPDGAVRAAEGRRRLTGVTLSTPDGERRMACDALVLSMGYSPRDTLLRMAGDLLVTGAGDVVLPGCSVDEAEQSGEAAGAGRGVHEVCEPEDVPLGSSGYVCLCEDVSVHDLVTAWGEGWHSSEILKRYTTATMGPCQGALCGRHLSAFARARSATTEDGAPATRTGLVQAGARTTARPPARTVRLGDLAAGVDEVIEKRTALHETHLTAGARLDWSGSWKRPYDYGDRADEYRAVRERVSVMDVSTLGRFLIGGRDAKKLVDSVFPCRIEDLAPGRSRYALALDEAGYVTDDGLVCALDGGRYFVTTTSGGADKMEAWLRNWVDRWELHVHVVNQTPMLGAINVAGPFARNLLSRLTDDALDGAAIPYPGHGEIVIAGVPCRVIRVGFVGELSFELHHARSQSVDLWTALIEVGEDLGIRPHGLDALDVLRLEKGHIYLGQDTLPDDHPEKLGLGWAVAMDKPSFIGRPALERMASLPGERRLVGLRFDAQPQRGAPLYANDAIVGRVTSCARSEVLGFAVGLGWLRAVDGEFPSSLRAGDVTATVVPTPFYDPEGTRIRA